MSFFAKRLDCCSCLKDLYKQVKGDKKKADGNQQRFERRTLMVCNECKIAQIAVPSAKKKIGQCVVVKLIFVCFCV